MLDASCLASAAAEMIGASLHRPFPYLDPGSGSFLLQLLVAGLLGALFALRAFWGRIKDRILRKRQTQDDEAESD